MDSVEKLVLPSMGLGPTLLEVEVWDLFLFFFSLLPPVIHGRFSSNCF